ncbi:MAG: hypothetical protein AB7U41_04540 [Dongiaceae bacterium]
MAKARTKKLLIAFVGIFVLIGAGITLTLDGIVKNSIERLGVQALGVKVDVRGVSISLLQGKAVVRGLTVANPPRFTAPHAIAADEISAELKLASLFHPVIEINEISVRSPDVYYEIIPQGANLKILEKNLEKAYPTKQEEAATSRGLTRRVVIRNLHIINPQVHPAVSVLGVAESRVVKVADIHLKNLGEKGDPMTSAEVMDLVLESLIKNVGAELPRGMIEQGLGKVKKGIGEMGKGLLNDLTN